MKGKSYRFAFHSERLARACLAISEYADIISIHTALSKERDLLENFGLG
jgi:hypothetical protein